MSEFKNFVKMMEQRSDEVPEKTAVFTIGRFNPPTKGHEKLIRKTYDIATEQHATPFIFATSTHDQSGKNPLTLEEKIWFIEQLMPNVKIANVPSVKNAWTAAEWLDQQGFTRIILTAGSDRITEYQQRWAVFAEDAFDYVDVVNVGIRDPDDDNIAGMSATKARQAALEGNLGIFRAVTGWDGKLSEQLMYAVQNGMMKR